MASFADRVAAGRVLADEITARRALAPPVVVLGLPRGGVPVARPVADALTAPLDVCVVRKLGLPGHRELAVGAIASGGVRVLNDNVLAVHPVSGDDLERVVAAEQRELERRERAYRGGAAPVDVTGATVVIVDDGLATGATMRAAAVAVRRRGAARVVCAAPVGPPAIASRLGDVADDVVLAQTPADFVAVGQFYADFSETTDDDVRRALDGRT